jgi:arsenate reductase
MTKTRVLFLCVHNAARSQIAAAYLNKLAGDSFHAESAGFEPRGLNPLAVDVMKEEGIDISANESNSVFEFFKQGRYYGYVISVCDAASAQQCPIFPRMMKRLSWSFEDPSAFTGAYEEKLAKTRSVRDTIKNHVEQFIREVGS